MFRASKILRLFRYFLVVRFFLIYLRLSPLAAIADTALNAKEEGKSDMRNEFIVSYF